MEKEQLDIVKLIENNPITKLSNDYNVKLLTKIKENFTDFEQNLFLSSFYCYLNYHPVNDFIVNLDNVWKWLGFSVKIKAKTLLEKYFIEGKDYIKSLYDIAQQSVHIKGGQNKEIFMLNVKTFKKFCLKAETKKSNEIHDYFMKLEEMLQETISEECNELKLQLEQNKLVLENVEKDKEFLKENTILEQFSLNTQCIYIGLIDDKTLGKPNSKMYQETVIKFGQSNNLNERVKNHKKTYSNFRLYAAFKVKNKIEIENCIKKHITLKNRLRIVTIDDIAHRELIALDEEDFTLEKVEQYIKDIIKENEYNVENYNLLLKKNDELQNEIYKLKNELDEKNQILEKNIKKINKLEYDVIEDIKGKTAPTYTLCKCGYYLYAYQYENMRYVCSISQQKDMETALITLKNLYPNGEMVCQLKCNYPLTEKNMTFILKQNCAFLGQNKYESTTETVTKIIEASIKLEEMLINQSKDVDVLLDIFSNNKPIINEEELNPEVPTVRKAKRSIDQINKDTGEVIKTYDSIEAAGRSLGLTTGTAIGTALRENRVCKGFLWRYSGVSKEEQFAEQPVVRVCCLNGEKTCFKNIADAAKDAKVSPPALRRRILTSVHVNNFHWIFNKGACHYK
jgi:hypothetical protein